MKGLKVTMAAKPMLDDLELEQVQDVASTDQEALARHRIPALEGDFLQDLGRRATRIKLTGVLTGPDAADRLKKLREKFHSAEPAAFVADIATATTVDKVLIEEMLVRDVAGKPERFEYAFSLREYVAPPPDEQAEASKIDKTAKDDGSQETQRKTEQVASSTGGLRVTVELEDGSQDFTGIFVQVEGTSDAGDKLSFTIDEQTGGVFSKDDVPAGQYTITAYRS